MEYRKADLMPKIYGKTIYLLLLTAASVFLAEFLIMIFFSFIPQFSMPLRAFLDASVLTIIVFPSLYMFLFRPLRAQRIRQQKLIHELKDAFSKIKTLRGLIPMCAWCKKIRDDQGYWDRVEKYVEEHSDAKFTHGICPECEEKVYAQLEEKQKQTNKG